MWFKVTCGMQLSMQTASVIGNSGSACMSKGSCRWTSRLLCLLVCLQQNRCSFASLEVRRCPTESCWDHCSLPQPQAQRRYEMHQLAIAWLLASGCCPPALVKPPPQSQSCWPCPAAARPRPKLSPGGSRGLGRSIFCEHLWLRGGQCPSSRPSLDHEIFPLRGVGTVDLPRLDKPCCTKKKDMFARASLLVFCCIHVLAHHVIYVRGRLHSDAVVALHAGVGGRGGG